MLAGEGAPVGRRGGGGGERVGESGRVAAGALRAPRGGALDVLAHGGDARRAASEGRARGRLRDLARAALPDPPRAVGDAAPARRAERGGVRRRRRRRRRRGSPRDSPGGRRRVVLHGLAARVGVGPRGEAPRALGARARAERRRERAGGRPRVRFRGRRGAVRGRHERRARDRGGSARRRERFRKERSAARKDRRRRERSRVSGRSRVARGGVQRGDDRGAPARSREGRLGGAPRVRPRADGVRVRGARRRRRGAARRPRRRRDVARVRNDGRGHRRRGRSRARARSVALGALARLRAAPLPTAAFEIRDVASAARRAADARAASDVAALTRGGAASPDQRLSLHRGALRVLEWDANQALGDDPLGARVGAVARLHSPVGARFTADLADGAQTRLAAPGRPACAAAAALAEAVAATFAGAKASRRANARRRSRRCTAPPRAPRRGARGTTFATRSCGGADATRSWTSRIPDRATGTPRTGPPRTTARTRGRRWRRANATATRTTSASRFPALAATSAAARNGRGRAPRRVANAEVAAAPAARAAALARAPPRSRRRTRRTSAPSSTRRARRRSRSSGGCAANSRRRAALRTRRRTATRATPRSKAAILERHAADAGLDEGADETFSLTATLGDVGRWAAGATARRGGAKLAPFVAPDVVAALEDAAAGEPVEVWAAALATRPRAGGARRGDER